MSGDADIAHMMQSYAEQAVRRARDLKVELDYGERSIQELEMLLARLSADPAATSTDEASRMWGGYLGEVVRRRFGGEWTIERYPAGDFLIVTLNVNGARIFPAMKVHRRLTEGESENLWTFYQSVKAKLEEKAGARVQ